MDLAFIICRTDCLCRLFNLLSTSMMPSLMFSIPIESQGLLGTLSNLELQILERRRMVELLFTISLIMCQCINPAGPLRDVDASCTGYTRDFQNLIRSGTACIVSSGMGTLGEIFKEIQEQVSEVTVVLPHCLGTGRAGGKEFLIFSLVKFYDKRFHYLAKKMDISLCHGVLVGRERSPIFYLVRKV